MVFKKIPDDLDAFEGELVIAVVGSDEKPLRATNAWLDWRLYGSLNTLVAKNYFNAALGEKFMLPTYGRFQFDRLVLLGGGPVYQSDAWPDTQAGRDLWRKLISMIEEALSSLKVSRVGLSLPRYELADQETALLKLIERAQLPNEISLFLSRAAQAQRSLPA
ncbi:MAG: hypothetical protein EA369_06650 [Bradymonadales bacterium]|nr:MAG: hypothetical protein EA369_06650 [Bradymonadales bacterium]